MKLYHIWQNVNLGYDTYDSAIVCAESEEDAKRIHPWDAIIWNDDLNGWVYKSSLLPVDSFMSLDWTDISNVQVEYIGEAKDGLEKGVLVASYNAG